MDELRFDRPIDLADAQAIMREARRMRNEALRRMIVALFRLDRWWHLLRRDSSTPASVADNPGAAGQTARG